MHHNRFCSQIISHTQDVLFSRWQRLCGIALFSETIVHINKLKAPEKVFVVLTWALGVCPAALTFHGVNNSDSVGKGKVATPEGKPQSPSGRDMQTLERTTGQMCVQYFHLSYH